MISRICCNRQYQPLVSKTNQILSSSLPSTQNILSSELVERNKCQFDSRVNYYRLNLFRSYTTINSNQLIHKREYHASIKRDSLIYYGLGVIGVSLVAHQLYKLSQEIPRAKPTINGSIKGKETSSSNASSSTSSSSATNSTTSSTTSKDGFFASFFARTFYDGGFEEKMTKREAALILGVRESATPERVKDAHRRILLLNHPDLGGSAFIAAKVNEAKAMLLKGKT